MCQFENHFNASLCENPFSWVFHLLLFHTANLRFFLRQSDTCKIIIFSFYSKFTIIPERLGIIRRFKNLWRFRLRRFLCRFRRGLGL
jgi:hypothetical protein